MHNSRRTAQQAQLSLLEQQIKRGELDAGESTRHNIANLVAPNSVGAEFGVDTGQFSERLISTGRFTTLHCVDKWDDHAHPYEQYLAVTKKLFPYKEARVWRMTAQQFSMLVPSPCLDFIYIDCYAHTGQDGGSVLTALWPKLKEGGLFCGDDYDSKTFPLTYRAVNQFADSLGKRVYVYDDHLKCDGLLRQDGHPSWYFFK